MKDPLSYHIFDSNTIPWYLRKTALLPAAPQLVRRVGLRTVCIYAYALLQTAGVGAASEESLEVGSGILTLVFRGSIPTQAVLLILIIFSIVSWAVIALKLRQFYSVDAQTSSFVEVFHRSSKFSEVQSVCKSLSHSPLAGVFQAGYVELNAQLRQSDDSVNSGNDDPTESSGRPVLRSFDALDRALLRAATAEVTKLERRVPFLATTASITPFIGLLGTVWGIILAFQGIGETGSTSLAVVAPGIAEALVATAAGLFAAIPAVYFYNHLTQKVKEMASAMDDFSLEFLNIAERNFS